MEINTKDELLSVIEDLQSRLALVEDNFTKEEPKEESKDEPDEQPASEESAEVESEDEIEKLLG